MANIRLSFRGEEYVIPDTQAFEAAGLVEEIATLAEVSKWFKNPKYNKLSRCYGELLRLAGCKVSDREVHKEIMDQIKQGGGDRGLAALEALGALVAVLMDGAPVDGDGTPPGKPNAS